MKTHWLFAGLFFLISPYFCEAKVIESAHIREVIPSIDEETWFLVDLDNTLFEGVQALGHAYWFYDEMNKRIIEQGMSREEAIDDVYPDWIKIQKVCRVQPLEEEFVSAIIELQNRGVVVMGFTHRHATIIEATIEQVASLRIDFAKTAPSNRIFKLPGEHPPLYQQGILFINDYNRKGDVILPFCDQVGYKPKRVVFVDDKRDNVEELDLVLATEGIDYLGVHYTAIQHAEPVYDPEIAALQYQFLDQIISNDAARILLENGINK